MAPGMIHRLVLTFQDISKALKAPCSCEEIERVVLLVHKAMSYQSRQFHTLEHVFGFLDGADAHRALGAIFHDLIYYQVDEGLQKEVEQIIAPFILRTGDRIFLNEAVSENETLYHSLRVLFGYEHNQELMIFPGLNEFLSALVMVKLLENHLKHRDLIEAAACIEASIPFRGRDSQGLDPFARMEQRLLHSPELLAYGFTPAEVDRIVVRAVNFANHDVVDFALEDPGKFLNNTWKLLPELNTALRVQGAYSITDYRKALQKMEAFFAFLNPEYVYHSYKGTPGAGQMESLAQRTRKNLTIAREYMQAKLLAASILEAAASFTGGDAPMALFMGDIPRGQEAPERLEDYLPRGIPGTAVRDTDSPVYILLEVGRMDESSFDLKNSPLALYIYQRLSPESFIQKVQEMNRFLKGEITGETYLKTWDRDTIAAIIEALCHLVITRREVWQTWLDRL